jgi:hypothetical protein
VQVIPCSTRGASCLYLICLIKKPVTQIRFLDKGKHSSLLHQLMLEAKSHNFFRIHE